MRLPSRPRHLVPGLCLLVPALVAVELPVIQVTIAPDGALVERAGLLPAGDEVVDGLPAGLDPAVLAVSVADRDRPAWRLRIDEPSAAPVPPDLARERDQALAALGAAADAIARARARSALADAALAPSPRPEGDPRPEPPPTTPADQAALAGFVAANRERAFAEEAAAVTERELQQARLTAVNARIDDAAPRGAARARLELPGAAGRMVRIAYRLADVRWAPSYRLEVIRGQAMLVELAQVDPGRGDRWNGAALAFTTRAADRVLVLPPLAVPQLGVADAVGAVAEPRSPIVARRPASADGDMAGEAAFTGIAAGGGAKGMFGSDQLRGRASSVGAGGRDSALDSGLRSTSQQQRADGSWGGEPFTTASTALATLSFLGVGYDQRMPSRYRSCVKRGLDALLARPAAQLDLASLALATTALAEAYAMTNDPALKGPTMERLEALAARAIAGGEAATWVNRGQPFAGPEILVWLTMAAKSAAAAGLPTGNLLEQLRDLPALVARNADADEARLTAAYVAIFTGATGTVLAPTEVQRLIARAPALLRKGRVELIYLTTVVCFHQGGEAWENWNAAVCSRLVADQRADGGWGYPHPAGEVVANALARLSLETYQRYAAVSAGDPLTGPRSAEPTLPDAAAAGHGWPVRWSVAGVALTPGQRTTLEIARIALPGTIRLRSIPVLEPTVWRSLPTRNPQPQPLPEGECELAFEGVAMGSTRLPFTPPGAAFTVPIGSDDQVRVLRTSVASSDDGVRQRTLSVDITLRLDAAAGWNGTVEVVEPLPRPSGDAIELILRSPPLAGKALTQRLDADPFQRAELSPGTGASTVIGWNLRYPAALRPFLEFE